MAIAGTVLSTVVGLCVFLAYGTTAAVARRVGAGDRVRRGARRRRRPLAGRWASGRCCSSSSASTAAPLVVALGASPETAGFAATYLRISALGLPAMLLVLAGTGVRRGLQDTRTPLVISVVAAVGNLGLAVLLVLGLGYGVAGSAWATVITQLACGHRVRRSSSAATPCAPRRGSAPDRARCCGPPARASRS